MLIASVGQTLTQDSHPVHFFLSDFAAIEISFTKLFNNYILYYIALQIFQPEYLRESAKICGITQHPHFFNKLQANFGRMNPIMK